MTTWRNKSRKAPGNLRSIPVSDSSPGQTRRTTSGLLNQTPGKRTSFFVLSSRGDSADGEPLISCFGVACSVNYSAQLSYSCLPKLASRLETSKFSHHNIHYLDLLLASSLHRLGVPFRNSVSFFVTGCSYSLLSVPLRNLGVPFRNSVFRLFVTSVFLFVTSMFFFVTSWFLFVTSLFLCGTSWLLVVTLLVTKSNGAIFVMK